MFLQTAAHVVGWLVRFPPATHKKFHHSAIAIVFLGSGTTGIWLFGDFWCSVGHFVQDDEIPSFKPTYTWKINGWD